MTAELNQPKQLSLRLLAPVALVVALSACQSAPEQAPESVALNAPHGLMSAASQGDMSEVRDRIAAGDPVNGLASDGSALEWAARAGHADVVSYLLEQGADPNRFTQGKPSPLMLMSAKGDRNAVIALLRKGADVNYADAKGASAVSEAVNAGNLSIVKLLLMKGANVNTSVDGKSLLMTVVEQGDLLMAQVLVDNGADVNFTSPQGVDALDVARATKNKDLEMLLVQSGAE